MTCTASGCRVAGVVPGYPQWFVPHGTAVEAVRLGAYALVRLGSYDGLAGAFLDGTGRPRSRAEGRRGVR